jgi:hypothetical protein
MVWYKKYSKFNNKKTVFNGLVYDSKFEAGYAGELALRLKVKEIKKIERQVRIPLDVNGFHICSYIADFVVTNKDGSKEIHETKGFATEVFRLKWKLLEALYPEYTLVLIQQKNSWKPWGKKRKIK